MNSARTHLLGAIVPALAAVTVAACGLSVDDLFTSGGSGGAGGAATTTSTHSSSHASSSSSGATSSSTTSSSTTTSSSSTSASSSSGGPVCGDGICEPTESATFCPQDCATTSSSSSGGTGDGGGPCSHSVCDTGDALSPSCNACVATVCAADSYCCMTAWDGQCADEASSMCGSCCGNGTCDNTEDCKSCQADCGPCAPEPQCPHSVCVTGEALSPQKCRDACVDQVCAQKPGCCGNASWDASCSILAAQLCGSDPCVVAVCAAMPACCSTGWTQACVDKAKTTCQTQCDCAHSICQQGGPLADTCNPCAKATCKADAYCCTTNWDGICTNEVGSVCGIVCP